MSRMGGMWLRIKRTLEWSPFHRCAAIKEYTANCHGSGSSTFSAASTTGLSSKVPRANQVRNNCRRSARANRLTAIMIVALADRKGQDGGEEERAADEHQRRI